jgi:hypothetical protein
VILLGQPPAAPVLTAAAAAPRPLTTAELGRLDQFFAAAGVQHRSLAHGWPGLNVPVGIDHDGGSSERPG